jgi:hypothetical protein
MVAPYKYVLFGVKESDDGFAAEVTYIEDVICVGILKDFKNFNLI